MKKYEETKIETKHTRTVLQETAKRNRNDSFFLYAFISTAREREALYAMMRRPPPPLTTTLSKLCSALHEMCCLDSAVPVAGMNKREKKKKRFRAPLARTKTGKNERNKTQIAKVLQIAWEHVKSLHSQESRHSSSPSFHSVPFPAHSSFFLYSACASCVIVVSVFFFSVAARVVVFLR